MRSGRRFLVPLTLLTLLVALALGQRAVERAAVAQNRGASQAPRFEVDPLWPAIPASINMGEVSSVAVDRNDHVWILHRPDSGPAVLEFDASGRYLRGGGGPADGYEWPAVAHGIFVDYKDNVWVGGRSGEPLDATGPGPDQFTNPPLQVTAVHCVTVSNDELVYVCDRDNRRIQVFTVDGTYRAQLFINRGAESRRSASRVAESNPGSRVQKFVLRGVERL